MTSGTRAKRNPEVETMNKVLDFITQVFPKDMEQASKEYRKHEEARVAHDERTYTRGFLTWFLLQRPIQGELTPLELAISFPLYFTRRDRQIMRNFLCYVESLFEVKRIAGKEFFLERVHDSKEYLVKTIDFPEGLLKEGHFIRALIVKNLEGHYFFYGNVWTYSREDAMKMKDVMLQEMRKLREKGKGKRREDTSHEVQWDIRPAKRGKKRRA